MSPIDQLPDRPDRIVLTDVTLDQPWQWLAAGAADFRRALPWSLGYGVAFVGIGAAITIGLLQLGFGALIPVAAGGFALLGPILAVGLYEMSRQINEDGRLDLGRALFVRTASPSQMALVGFALGFAFLLWANVARLLFALFISGNYPTLSEWTRFLLTDLDGLKLLAIGSLSGGLIGFGVFAISAISLPILMRRRVDVVTAMAASIDAVRENPGPMILWAWIIAVAVAVGFATLGLGLAVAFPVLGHATWHAYRALVEPKAA